MDFIEYAKDVQEFNWYKHGDKECFTEEELNSQWKLVEEEYKELLEAISVGPNLDLNVKAELADLFVVSSYYCYMEDQYLSIDAYSERPFEYLLGLLQDRIEHRLHRECLNIVCGMLEGLDGTEFVLRAKLASNWSKIPKLSEFCRRVRDRWSRGSSRGAPRPGRERATRGRTECS